ncbi:MAG: tetratricopeptide repeat-containing protein [Burkholderiaceae bacterium]
MPLNAFIVRPFGVKAVEITTPGIGEALAARQPSETLAPLVTAVERIGESSLWTARIDFDVVQELLLRPALAALRIQGDAASAVVVAGNIREDMFNRLITADVVIADLSVHNPNVYYELGIRQAFRDKYTFLIRSNLSRYPFDLETDRYFEYSLTELIDAPQRAIGRLVKALRATINSPEADSPIFKLLPQLEVEDRARFIAVPEEFREEVERAKRHRRREHLSLLAVECEGFLWEAEGLRVVARAQFESNFIDGAKCSWEQIATRYPDDIEANTVLSTIYQRQCDTPRSEQALSRVARSRSLSPTRLSQLRALSGRNIKEAWIGHWRNHHTDLAQRQKAALRSPLLQRAFDAFHAAFKADLNNAYAGLNALTLLVIQTELAHVHEDVWASIQPRPDDAKRALEKREGRTGQLIAALELAVESDRDRLRQQGSVDPWFDLLAAAVECIISSQPERVAQLYEEAKHFAPENAEESMRRALQVYCELGIQGRGAIPNSLVGTVGSNVKAAMQVLKEGKVARAGPKHRQRILMFVGLRLDENLVGAVPARPNAPDSATPAEICAGRRGFPRACVDTTRTAILDAIDAELALKDANADRCDIVFGLAAGANGGDLLFHEACRERGIPSRMCLALPRAQYVGQYVASAGSEWVERFSAIYRHVRSLPDRGGADAPIFGDPVSCFTDANDMPRWLQGRPYYNVGRRNSLWMLQHAISAANELGADTEITLLALWNEESSEGGFGGIGSVVRMANTYGVKVRTIAVPHGAAKTAARPPPDALPATHGNAAQADSTVKTSNGTQPVPIRSKTAKLSQPV